MAEDIFTKAAQVAFANNGSQAGVAEPEEVAAETQDMAQVAAEQPAQQVAEENNAETVVAEEAKPAEASEPYNYWPDLDQKTEGLVKDEETFNSILERSKNYDTLALEKAELEKNQFKPANDYVAKFNDLILGGAKEDQIKAFVKLNEYGNIEDLAPVEAKVAKMVLLEGYSEDVARKIVDRNFNLSQFDEEIPEEKESADIMREELRVSAKSDLEALKEYRKDLSVVHNPEKEQAEKIRLENIASISTYNKTVAQEAPSIAKNFPSKLNFEFKIGDETVNFEDKIDNNFLEKELPELVRDYFEDSLDPVNQETIGQAYGYAIGEYLKANVQTMIERAYGKGLAEGQEKTVNKYENKSGLPRSEENTVAVAANEEGVNSFIRKKLGK